MADELAASCARIIGEEHVLTDAGMRASYETDWTGRFRGSARFVVRPGSAEEVGSVLKACSAAGAAVVPQGGNTGLVGGSVPRGGEVVLSLGRLTQMEAVDETAGEVTVEAGATLEQVQQRALSAGYGFGVDVASRGSATIGGMIATNAGGIHVLAHGPMRSQVIGIEAVLADGQIVRRLPGLSKDNTGYDLPGLIAGSEGTLAVVTRARLRLMTLKPERVTALLRLGSMQGALATVRAVRGLPSLDAVEVFFPEGLDLVCRHGGMTPPFRETQGLYLLIECAGQRDPTDDLATALEGVEFEDSAIARERSDRERLWAYRERHTEAINAEGIPHKLDISVPLAAMGRFTDEVGQRLAKSVPEARLILFGHLADGNLHVNVLGVDPEDERAEEAVFGLVASLGGSISAEHGIGVAKRRWLHLTRSGTDIRTMQAIKAALDPRGTLNPGVMLPGRGD